MVAWQAYGEFAIARQGGWEPSGCSICSFDSKAPTALKNRADMIVTMFEAATRAITFSIANARKDLRTMVDTGIEGRRHGGHQGDAGGLRGR